MDVCCCASRYGYTSGVYEALYITCFYIIWVHVRSSPTRRIMSIPGIGYLARRISQILCRQLKRAIMIDYRNKHKTFSYISILTVSGSQICTMSTVCGSRGVEPRSLLKKRFLRRSAVSCANSSGNVYLSPTYDSACNLVSSEASCGVSELHLSG